jgi:hypothetical protein
MFNYEMNHICSYTATLDPEFEVIGPVAEGLRLNAYITGGEVTGPRLQGLIRPVGADWLIIRTDGVGVLDVRATIETHDGALIHMYYSGVGDFGGDGYQNFLDGKHPNIIPLRTVPMLQTAHPDYQWVNRLQFVNIGEVNFEASMVSYDLYALQ